MTLANKALIEMIKAAYAKGRIDHETYTRLLGELESGEEEERKPNVDLSEAIIEEAKRSKLPIS